MGGHFLVGDSYPICHFFFICGGDYHKFVWRKGEDSTIQGGIFERESLVPNFRFFRRKVFSIYIYFFDGRRFLNLLCWVSNFRGGGFRRGIFTLSFQFFMCFFASFFSGRDFLFWFFRCYRRRLSNYQRLLLLMTYTASTTRYKHQRIAI